MQAGTIFAGKRYCTRILLSLVQHRPPLLSSRPVYIGKGVAMLGLESAAGPPGKVESTAGARIIRPVL